MVDSWYHGFLAILLLYIRWLIILFTTLPWTFEPCKLWRLKILKGYADSILQHLCAICPLYYISLEEASKCHNFGKNYNPFSWLFWWSRDITPQNLVEYGLQSQSPGLEAFITPNHQLRRGICWIFGADTQADCLQKPGSLRHWFKLQRKALKWDRPKSLGTNRQIFFGCEKVVGALKGLQEEMIDFRGYIKQSLERERGKTKRGR